MPQELELIEENSESCPVGTTTPGGFGGIPIWMIMAVGVMMVVGIVYMSGDEKSGEVK
jgi:hypothetical protein